MLYGFAESTPTRSDFEMSQVTDLFGGPGILKHRLAEPMDAHDMILQGIPGPAFENLVNHLAFLKAANSPESVFEKAFGMSERTFQRFKADPTRSLNTEQSSKAWKFARVLARATAILGSQADAERWINETAIGLDGNRPIDLLATPAGAEIVEEYLERIDYGVYV